MTIDSVVDTPRRIRMDVAQGAAPGGQVHAADVTQVAVFTEILRRGPVSRTEVAERLDLSASTVTKAVNPLVARGYVLEAGVVSSPIGRPRRLVRVASDRHTVIGIKIAPSRVVGSLTDLEARQIARAEVPLAEGHEPGAAISAVVRVVRTLLDGHPQPGDRLLGIGVCLGGHVDAATGRCVSSGVLGWTDVGVGAAVQEATGLPVVVENDVNALATAELWFGAGRDTDTFAVVTIGAGLGCALVFDRRLHRGASGIAGELGHLPLVPDGARCSCGNRGCLETVVSDQEVLRSLRADGIACPDIESAYALAQQDPGPVQAAFTRYGESVGRALAVVGNLLNPPRLILTGEGTRGAHLFEAAMRDSFQVHAFSSAARDCVLTVELVDDDVWARGAACLVIHDAVAGAGAV